MAYLATDGAVDGGVPISEFPTLVGSLGYANVDGATAARLAEVFSRLGEIFFLGLDACTTHLPRIFFYYLKWRQATGMNGPLMSRHNCASLLLLWANWSLRVECDGFIVQTCGRLV